jgi:hypothetical protein
LSLELSHELEPSILRRRLPSIWRRVTDLPSRVLLPVPGHNKDLPSKAPCDTNTTIIYPYHRWYYDMRLPSRDRRLGHASLARVACSTLEPMSLCAGRSLVKRTLLAIDHRVGGFLEIWSRVYVVIMLRIIGF